MAHDITSKSDLNKRTTEELPEVEGVGLALASDSAATPHLGDLWRSAPCFSVRAVRRGHWRRSSWQAAAREYLEPPVRERNSSRPGTFLRPLHGEFVFSPKTGSAGEEAGQ